MHIPLAFTALLRRDAVIGTLNLPLTLTTDGHFSLQVLMASPAFPVPGDAQPLPGSS